MRKQMIGNHQCKMVVFLATALALGAGAVAACVIPWFYCKPPDADDESHGTTGSRDANDPGSHYQSAVDENLNPATNIRINGISYVRVVVPPNSSSNQPTIPTSTILDSTTLNSMSPEDPVNEGVKHPIHAHNVEIDFQPSRNAVDMTSRLKNSEIIKEVRRTSESATNFNNTKALGSKSENSSSLRSGLITPDIVGMQVLIKNEESPPVGLSTKETSNLTDESRSELTIRTSSASSELLNSDSIRPYNPVTKSAKISCSTSSSIDPESSALTSSSRTEERSSTTLTTSDPSNRTDNSSTGTTTRTSTSQKSENSSSGPTKVVTIAVVESSKMSDFLETIQEVSTSPAATPSPKTSRQSDYRSSRFNKTPYPWVGNEESIISSSTRASNHARFRSNPSNKTLSIPGTSYSTQSASKRQDAEMTKSSRGSRYVEALSNRIKKIWRGIKTDTSSKNGRTKNDHKKYPKGHSTLISEDQHLLDTIRNRRSPKVKHACLLKTFEDPGIPINDNPNCPSKFGFEEDEEPLDLSVRSSPEHNNNKTAKTFTGKKRLNRSADSCKEVFREVAEYLKVRKSSKSSEDVISISDSLIFSNDISKMCPKDENQNVRSDSLMFSNDISKICPKDENQNVRSNCSAAGNAKVGDTASYIGDSHADKLDKMCLPKSKRFPRSIKKIFHIGSRDRNKRHNLSSPVQHEQTLNSASVKCLENSVSTSSQLESKLNVNVIRTPDSCTDMSSYFELGVAKSDDNKYLDEPCTEL